MSRGLLDRASLLVTVPGAVTLQELEAELALENCTLSLGSPSPDQTVAEWLGEGAPGARSPWDDPADHLLAGYVAKNVVTGDLLVVRAAPRRSVGPDLSALVLGMRERFFVVTSATLRVFPHGVAHVEVPFASPDDAPVGDGERALLDRIADELAKPADELGDVANMR